VAQLDALGLAHRRAEPGGDVVGEVDPAERDHRGVHERAVDVDHDVGGAAADVDHGDADLALVLGEHRLGAREGLEHQLGHVEPAALGALGDVLHAGDRGGDEVDAGLEADAATCPPARARRPAGRPRSPAGARGSPGGPSASEMRRAWSSTRSTSSAVTSWLAIDTMPCELTPRTWEPAMPAYTVAISHAGHVARALDRLLDGGDRALDVDHHALAQPLRAGLADAGHVDPVDADLPHDRERSWWCRCRDPR
jgi:hypothetical protein